VAARSKTAASLAGTAGSIPARGMDVSFGNVVCCKAKVSATGRSIVQRSPTERYRERMYVCVCVSLSVIRCNSNTRQ
jgi:hypothetical protein